jgi:hypothetical protein
MIFRRNLKMNNEFIKWMEENKDNAKNVTADDVRESMAKADAQEKALCIALHSLFAKKRVSTANMVKALESMDMMLSILKLAGPNDLAKDIPDDSLTVNAGKDLILAIDGVISALQQYNLANENLNEAVRQGCDKKEEFKNNLGNNRDE